MERYVITSRDGSLFYDIDRDSGYPYASPFSYKTFTNLKDALRELTREDTSKYAFHNGVIREIKFVEVDHELVKSYMKIHDHVQQIVQNLTPEELNILKGLIK